ELPGRRAGPRSRLDPPHESPAGPGVSGLPAVPAAAGFPVAAPDIIGGRSRSSVDLRDGTVFIRHGEGSNGIALIERKTATSTTGHGFLDNQPSVTVDGVRAHELTTTLGSALTWHADGTTYVLAARSRRQRSNARSRKSANRLNLTPTPTTRKTERRQR